MKNVIEIRVTKEDLKADFWDRDGCPLYKALTRKGYAVDDVGALSVGLVSYPSLSEADTVDYFILEYQELIESANITKEPLTVHLLKID
jgi:hypothetical protein